MAASCAVRAGHTLRDRRLFVRIRHNLYFSRNGAECSEQCAVNPAHRRRPSYSSTAAREGKKRHVPHNGRGYGRTARPQRLLTTFRRKIHGGAAGNRPQNTAKHGKPASHSRLHSPQHANHRRNT